MLPEHSSPSCEVCLVVLQREATAGARCEQTNWTQVSHVTLSGQCTFRKPCSSLLRKSDVRPLPEQRLRPGRSRWQVVVKAFSNFWDVNLVAQLLMLESRRC